MPNKKDDCYGLGLAKKFYSTYKSTEVNNPITSGNKAVDKALINSVTKSMPYVGHFVKGVDTFNKTYQTGANIARAKAIYDECKKKK